MGVIWTDTIFNQVRWHDTGVIWGHIFNHSLGFQVLIFAPLRKVPSNLHLNEEQRKITFSPRYSLHISLLIFEEFNTA